ncbi:MAG: hypothetical protein JF612_14915 [Planctomycetia bacterium]|nr:hypothetical protein [Planctomycetia bacterium]
MSGLADCGGADCGVVAGDCGLRIADCELAGGVRNGFTWLGGGGGGSGTRGDGGREWVLPDS